jgi:hypothetical protein
LKHTFIDSGGIVRAGGPALVESVEHAVSSAAESALEPVGRWLGGLERDIRRLYGAP